MLVISKNILVVLSYFSPFVFDFAFQIWGVIMQKKGKAKPCRPDTELVVTDAMATWFHVDELLQYLFFSKIVCLDNL